MRSAHNGKATVLRVSVTVAALLFALFSAFYFAVKGLVSEAFLGLITLLLIMLPHVFEKLFKCRVATPLYIVTVIYACGSMLGDGYKLYYHTVWWDKLLHTAAGFIFAAYGIYILYLLSGRVSVKPLCCACFAFCFSLTVCVLWEFYEFGYDTLLDGDMQNDTVVTEINSYLLGDEPDVCERIENITVTDIDGTEIQGYIDIGLIDTMWDLIVAAVGAFTVSLAHLISRGKFCPAVPSAGEWEEI